MTSIRHTIRIFHVNSGGGGEGRLCSGDLWQAYGTLLEHSMSRVRNELTKERG